MDFQPYTSVRLSLPNLHTKNHINNDDDRQINLELNLDHRSSSSNSSSSSRIPAESRFFSCNYCQRKFYSPQALGGHQNAHKLERTLAKKSRELLRNSHGTSSNSSSRSAPTNPLPDDEEIGYGRREMMKTSWLQNVHHVHDHHHDFTQLDLSLRL